MTPRKQSRIADAQEAAIEQSSVPSFITPMKATLVHESFSSPHWIYERKLDGERLLARKENRDVSLWSRNRNRKERVYPEIRDTIAALPGNFIMDGELVAFEQGRTSFERLQRRMHVQDPDRQRQRETPVFYYLFDLPHLAGFDLRKVPQRRRKEILRQAFTFEDPIRFTPHRYEAGEVLLARACRRGWEGLIAKRADAADASTRSRDWLKLKCSRGQEFVLGGFTDPQGSRIGFGAVLCGYDDDDGALLYAGRVGTGFDDALLRELSKQMQELERQRCPFADFEESTQGVHWIKPELVGEVRFNEWTEEGRLRHPRFVGRRDDKDPRLVHREHPAAQPEGDA